MFFATPQSMGNSSLFAVQAAITFSISAREMGSSFRNRSQVHVVLCGYALCQGGQTVRVKIDDSRVRFAFLLRLIDRNHVG